MAETEAETRNLQLISNFGFGIVPWRRAYPLINPLDTLRCYLSTEMASLACLPRDLIYEVFSLASLPGETNDFLLSIETIERIRNKTMTELGVFATTGFAAEVLANRWSNENGAVSNEVFCPITLLLRLYSCYG